MSEIEQKINSTEQENAIKLFGYVKKAAEKTHTVIMAAKKSQKAIYAIQSEDKTTKWMVLQEYLKEYTSFINKTTFITGVHVCSVDKNFFENATPQEINQQLQIIIGIVYLKDATNSVGKESFKECLKKLVEPTGLFTKAQLNLL